jgi:hypothetical protein
LVSASDLTICLTEARRNGARLPAAALIDQFNAEVQAMDGGRWDTSSLIARLERWARLIQNPPPVRAPWRNFEPKPAFASEFNLRGSRDAHSLHLPHRVPGGRHRALSRAGTL